MRRPTWWTPSVRFLAASALEARRKEEVEERARRITETEQLLAVPRALRTPEQKRRIDELCAESLASRYPQLARRKRKRRRKKKLPRCTLPRQGCRRLCDHQRQDPTVCQTLGIPVVTQRQVPTMHLFMLPVQFLDTVLDMSVVLLRPVLVLMVQNSVLVPQLSFIGVASFVPQRQIPMVQTVQLTTEIPQMPFVFRWSMPLLCRFCASQVVSLRTQRTAWFDSGYMRCVSLWSISYFLRVLVDSGS